jgi:redox-sensitive bicupin YhaK (pirin superfamily)
MQYRAIHKVINAPLFNMGDLQVRQPLPSTAIEYLDPFVLLHHGHVMFEQSIDLKHAGVGPHPHRGFSPVTYVF